MLSLKPVPCKIKTLNVDKAIACLNNSLNHGGGELERNPPVVKDSVSVSKCEKHESHLTFIFIRSNLAAVQISCFYLETVQEKSW